MELAGKVALVTGAGSGLGRSIALAFARAGASLALIDIDEGTAQATLDATGADGAVAAADIAVTPAVEQAVEHLADRVGAPDVVINNAGIAGAGRRPLHETSIEDWERVLAVNLTGAFLVCRAALPLLLERGAGVIVNVASAAGLVALPGRSGYAASKAGLIHLTRTLAVEYAEAGIRANALCPGYADTPLVAAGFADAERAARLLRMIPMRRVARPDEIASAALFLASEASAYMTGQTLVVDGGWTAI